LFVTIAFQAALLHNVEFRYQWDLIYTYVGHLLLAVNPYKSLGVYVEEMVQACVTSQSNVVCPDHVFLFVPF
jgi:myosin-1